MTFLDLVRKVGELGRAKCHPDCDIVVHRREAAMYMGVLRENPELLRELTATPSSGVTEGEAESGECPCVKYGLADVQAWWMRDGATFTCQCGSRWWYTNRPEPWGDHVYSWVPQPPAPADEGKAESGERIRVTNGVVAIYRPDRGALPIRNPWHCYNTYDGSFIECRTDEDVAGYRELSVSNPAVPADDGFGEEYWRGHSVGRCEERERLEPSDDDNAALTDLIRNGLLGDDGIGVQYQRTDDGLPRDLARWITDAGWRKPGADDAATVLAGLRQEMEQFEEGLKQGAWATGKPAGLSWATGVRYAIALVEAAQQRLADRGQSGMPDEFEPYLAEAMKRPGFRAAYEAALRDEENTDG